MNRDNEMVLQARVVPATYPGMKMIEVRLEKDEAWDPPTVLKTFYEGELNPDIRKLNGMYFGEAKRYVENLSVRS